MSSSETKRLNPNEVREKILSIAKEEENFPDENAMEAEWKNTFGESAVTPEVLRVIVEHIQIFRKQLDGKNHVKDMPQMKEAIDNQMHNTMNNLLDALNGTGIFDNVEGQRDRVSTGAAAIQLAGDSARGRRGEEAKREQEGREGSDRRRQPAASVSARGGLGMPSAPMKIDKNAAMAKIEALIRENPNNMFLYAAEHGSMLGPRVVAEARKRVQGMLTPAFEKSETMGDFKQKRLEQLGKQESDAKKALKDFEEKNKTTLEKLSDSDKKVYEELKRKAEAAERDVKRYKQSLQKDTEDKSTVGNQSADDDKNNAITAEEARRRRRDAEAQEGEKRKTA